MNDNSNPYVPNSSKKAVEDMLKKMGINRMDELYRDISQRIPRHELKGLPIPQSEIEVLRTVQSIVQKNKSTREMQTFLGAGVWPHYVPAVVDAIVSRGEFLTSYTPYQAEISQGMLQALFEYQSVIAELLDMDVVNSSLYDWSTALGEAALLAKRVTQRNNILVPYVIHPDRLKVLESYTEASGMKIHRIPCDKESGQLSLQKLRDKSSDDVAAVYVEIPSYLGFIEEQADEISRIAHEKGSLFIAGVDPISLGVIRPPGDYGADVAIGEGQPLGNHMNFGGPLLGIFSCRDDQKMMRQMPGRITGLTTTLDGNETGFVLTLQTREQHIRREKATSNITSNEALCALAALIYCSLLGARGIREVGETILTQTNYSIRKLSRVKGLRTPVFKSSHFKEFTVNIDESRKSIHTFNKELLNRGIQGGHPIDSEFPELGNTALLCVTETHSKEDIDKLILAAEEIMEAEQ
ncbi:MAG: aminomethyl-transferring glycine dehydrogenase subunit GcvPA [Candidatus Atabeyarchaeum deiterrae]